MVFECLLFKRPIFFDIFCLLSLKQYGLCQDQWLCGEAERGNWLIYLHNPYDTNSLARIAKSLIPEYRRMYRFISIYIILYKIRLQMANGVCQGLSLRTEL